MRNILISTNNPNQSTLLAFRKRFSLLVIFVLVLAGCSSASATLANTTWHLISFGPTDNPTAAMPDVETSLSFGEDNQLSGSMGCNQFSGGYVEKGSEITFDAISSTLLACDEARMQQESGVFSLLSGTNTFSIEGDILTITSPDGSMALVFQK
jgi:heat shock protein HslJ